MSDGSAVDMSVVDGLLSWLGDDGRERLVALLETHDSQANTLMSEMGQALDEGDLGALRRSAHSLRGASATLGAPIVADICTKLETDQAASPGQLREALSTLATEHQRFVAEMRAVLADNGGG